MQPIYNAFELPTDTTWMEIPEFSPHAYEVEVAEYKGTTNKVVMIIVWKWGTTSGYQNKYTTIASNLAEKYWAQVFVVENPWISRDDPKLFVECVKNRWKNLVLMIGRSMGWDIQQELTFGEDLPIFIQIFQNSCL